MVRWDASNKSASYTLQSRGDFKFELVCSNGVKVKEEIAVDDIYYLESNLQGLEVVRLPQMSSKVWYHTASGEKHRLRVCASDHLYLLGVGLRIKEDVSRVNVTIRLNDTRLLYQSYEHVPKSHFIRALHFDNNVFMECDQIYSIVVTMFGGASYVGSGGEEFIEVGDGGTHIFFKFDDDPHQDDVVNQTTIITEGLIEKLYFDI